MKHSPLPPMRLPLLVSLILLAAALSARTYPPVPWIPAEVPAEPAVWGERKWGFADPEGNLVLAPRFDAARAFSEGLAAVKEGGKWGFVQSGGLWVIKPAHLDARFFRQGLAAALTLTRGDVGLVPRWGYLDNRGRWAMEAKYDWAGDFGDGIAPVGEGERVRRERRPDGQIVDVVRKLRFRWIDARGKVQIDPDVTIEEATLPAGPGRLDFEAPIGSFQEGLAPIRKGGRWGYLGRSNQTAVPFRFDQAQGFSQGKAWVREAARWKTIDRAGNVLFESTLSLSAVLPFQSNQTAWALREDGRWGLFDAKGGFKTRAFPKRGTLLSNASSTNDVEGESAEESP